MRRLGLSGLLVVLGLVSPAQAQNEVWNPISGVYLPPVGRPPLSSCQIALETAIANHLSYDSGAWGEIAVDLEEIRLTPQIYAPTPWGELSVQVPLRLYYGGFLDYLLNPIHEMLRLPVSPLPPQTYLSMRRQGQPPREITAPVFGLGDLVLGWAFTGPEKSWGRVSLAIPLGDSSRYLGSGGFRAAVVVGWDEETWGLLGQLAIPFGPQPVFGDFGTRPSLGLRGWTRLPWDLPGRLELQATTSPLQVGGEFAAVIVALRYVLDKFSFGEDVTPAVPDVALTWKKQWGCWW
jgi:hypothetical protein